MFSSLTEMDEHFKKQGMHLRVESINTAVTPQLGGDYFEFTITAVGCNYDIAQDDPAIDILQMTTEVLSDKSILDG